MLEYGPVVGSCKIDRRLGYVMQYMYYEVTDVDQKFTNMQVNAGLGKDGMDGEHFAKGLNGFRVALYEKDRSLREPVDISALQ